MVLELRPLARCHHFLLQCLTPTVAHAAGKWAAGAVSASYSAHSRGQGWFNNRNTHSAGGKDLADVWQAHIATQMDLVFYTTWPCPPPPCHH